MTNEWTDARKWARVGTIPAYFIVAMYGGPLVFLFAKLAYTGELWKDLHNTTFLVMIGWGLFAVAFGLFGIISAHRARRYCDEHCIDWRN